MKIDVVLGSKDPLDYYGEEVIKQGFDSIINQTYPHWRVLLCNYGNFEKTKELKKFFPDKNKVVVVNDGADAFTKSLNSGLKYSNRDLIGRQDLDDWSDETRFEKQVDFLEKNPEVALVGTQAFIYGKDKVARKQKKPAPVFNWLQILQAVRRCNPMVHGSVMFRRNPVLEEVGYYDEAYRCTQDFEYWCRIMLKLPMATIEEPLYYWRDHGKNISYKMGGESPGNKGVALSKWGKKLDQFRIQKEKELNDA